MKVFNLRFLIFCPIIFAAFGNDFSHSQGLPPEIPEEAYISAPDAYTQIKDGDVPFIFLDQISYYLEKHPTGSTQFSFFRYDDFQDVYPDRDQTIILTSAYSSYLISRFFYHLKENDYEKIYLVRGGLSAWEREGLPMVYGNEMNISGKRYRVYESSIEKWDNEEWSTQKKFTKPAFSLLKKYQDMIPREGIQTDWFERQDLFDVTSTIDVNFRAPKVQNQMIWFGIGYYEGEGVRGYGGVGFYNPDLNTFGILRLPALLGCSVRELLFKDERLYIATEAVYELDGSFCNGLVELDLSSLETVQWLPPGFEDRYQINSQGEWSEWVKYYDKSIGEIIKGNRFSRVDPTVHFKQEKIEEIKEIGLENYMMDEYRREVEARQFAVENPDVAIDSTFTIQNFEEPVQIRIKWDYNLRIAGREPLWGFIDIPDKLTMIGIYPPEERSFFLFPPHPFYEVEFENLKDYKKALAGEH